MPKQKGAAPNNKDDPEYLERRARNNEAIKKSREKARLKAAETKDKVDSLKDDNKRLEDKIDSLGKEMTFLKEVFVAHASNGSAVPPATATSATLSSSSSPPLPVKTEEPGEPGAANDLDLLNSILTDLEQPHPHGS